MTQRLMRQRITFETRNVSPDGAGNTETTGWTSQFARGARVHPLRGGEEVTAARLQGTQPVIITVRSDSQTRTIDSTWRANDQRNGVVYDIKSISNNDEKNIYLDLMCVAGVGDAQGPD